MNKSIWSTSTLLVLLVGAGLALPSAAEPASKPVAKHSKKTKHKAAAEKEFVDFNQWSDVNAFLDEMASKHGFDRAELTTLMGQVRFVDAAVQLVKPGPPGKPKNWHAYSKLLVDSVRIEAGQRFWAEHADALARAEREYGVPAEIIVGILGVETVYGRNTGRFRLMDALTTLAFAYPEAPARTARMAFFREELENTLLYARQNKVDPLSLLGSFAGAYGLPQFMPGSMLRYGVDFDGDGKLDLRNSADDAIGSVANFLVKHGWQRDAPGPVYAVTVSASHAWDGFLGQGLVAKFKEESLRAAGVKPQGELPPDTLFGLIDLQNGAEATEFWLATGNFYAITQYNRSYFYAMSVIELGKAVRQARSPAPPAS